MKIAKGLGLFVALALLGTGCGKGAAPAPQGGTDRADVQAVEDDQGKEAKPNAQENEAQQQVPDQKDGKTQGQTDASAEGQGGKETTAQGGTNTANAGGSDAIRGGTPAATPASKPAATPAVAPAAPKPQGQLLLSVTHNFGSSSVFNQNVAVGDGQSLIDLMREHFDVETAYGGGFVNGINGTKSAYTDKSVFTRKKIDWFYYSNGSVSAIGADALQPKPGDTIWWDYHAWSGQGSSTPCVVGAYPHPFTTGYNGATPGTVIYYSGPHADDANRLAQGLRNQGAGNVSTAAYQDGSILHSTKNVIVLGTWSELSGQSAMGEVFGDPARTGVYAKFDGNTVTALNSTGKSGGRTGQGAILATGQGSGDASPTWLVLGATEAGLDAAVDAMVNSPGKLKGKIGVVIDGSEAVGVPVAQ
ncbi:MAG: DUF4430 domain-containing protein [Tumebacillaceae bacterium]